ncbi:hypothetical protein WMO64_16655 [Pseudoflavonifractor sp. CLA-AP-H29]|uniref:Holin n=1 Tax=Pseudoflavonifractor intestinihominis TaxID=3133171 RepID=A0ABV1ECN9_9FIRM
MSLFLFAKLILPYLENMVALGVDVPDILLKGLAAAKTAVDEAGNKVVPEDGDTVQTENKNE